MTEVERAGPNSPEWSRAILFDNIFSSWTDLTPALVINRPSEMASNGSKVYQASLIKSLGFDIPDTLVTTDKTATTEFCERHRVVIYKSLSGIRSIVMRFSADHVNRLDYLANCPTQF
jgi:hypothetical protein